ncbi:DUF6346 domain-containing protein [Lentzea sp. DG1S-22]|uniref:DUF6346 domain-containing protein n=1 Tax=Lentzea sp. DG1S-22 TaxID=3108822 RepID=UPI002E780959|nr:DUF6346 domain-containing protein [Lentzea sp. DG1S-22]WVH77513.1 DUF6346 domain-containing protein [Lentzea sp. DG1S-22]
MRALAFLLAAVFAFLALATTIRTTDVLLGAVEARQTGTAAVVSCTEHGPVGRWGVGTSHGCDADVRWEDGSTERVAFPPGQLEPGAREVAVFRSTRDAGVNDSARWFLAGPLLAVALGLLALWFAVAAVLSLVPGRKTPKPDEKWPLTEEDVRNTPVTRRVRRLRLLAWLGLATAAAEGLASMPFFDAPRRVGAFASPWPQLEEAWLVDLPSGVLAGFAVLVAAVIGLIAENVHRDAARVVRYGQSYLDGKKPVPSGGSSWVPTALLAALVVWAVVEVVLAVGDAPPLVWLAGSRDALVLLAVLAVVASTRQSAKDVVAQLVRE